MKKFICVLFLFSLICTTTVFAEEADLPGSNEENQVVVDVEYVENAGELIIVHTIVPSPLEGRGLASALVAAAYKYADEKCLKRVAVCEYAKKWLEKHSDG